MLKDKNFDLLKQQKKKQENNLYMIMNTLSLLHNFFSILEKESTKGKEGRGYTTQKVVLHNLIEICIYKTQTPNLY